MVGRAPELTDFIWPASTQHNARGNAIRAAECHYIDRLLIRRGCNAFDERKIESALEI